MHEVTINLDTLLWIMGFLAAFCGLIVYLKKGTEPIFRPYKQMRSDVKMLAERKHSCDQKFAHDAAELAEIKQDLKMVMKTETLLLKHAETGNCTGEVAAGRKELEDYLIDKD